MESRRFPHHIWWYLLLVSAVVLVAGGTAFAVSSMADPTYAAEARLIVSAGLGTEGGGTDDVLAAPRVGSSYAVLATTRPVLLEAIGRANLPYDATELLNHVTVIANLDTPFLMITMSDPNPVRAADGANALADVLVERSTIPATAEVPTVSLLEIVERARAPSDPVGPRVLFNTVLAAAAAFVTAVVLVAVVAYIRAGPPASRATTSG
jgi:capsular polysaccharide biosynthesis protein